jgi:hypothetical protein
VSGLNPAAVPERARGAGTGINDRARVRTELVARLTPAIAAKAPKQGHHSHGSFTHMPMRVSYMTE